MLRYGLTGLMVVGLLAAGAWGAVSVLVLKDGRTFEGEVTRTADGYRVKTKMATLVFQAKDVEKVVEQVDPRDEYAERAGKIDPNSARDHMELGRWAEGKGLLEIAKKEYEKALGLDKDLEVADLLLRRVKARLAGQKPPPDGPDPVVGPQPDGPEVIDAKWLVREDDVYKIRMGEYVPDRDKRVAVKFRGQVLKKFIEQMRGEDDHENERFDEDKFKSLASQAKARYIVKNTEWDDPVRTDVILTTDPEPMREFRSRIWPRITVHCGTVQCHGAPKGKGRLKLLATPARNERVDFANFMILSQFQRGPWSLIDRQHPEDSLLLTYGMRKEDVKPEQAHPKDLPAAIYLNTKSAAYQQMLKWIQSLKAAPEGGKYGVKYGPPAGEVKPKADQKPNVEPKVDPKVDPKVNLKVDPKVDPRQPAGP